MVEGKEVPSTLGISDDMRIAYAALQLTTPFSKFANAALWEKIEAIRKEVSPDGSELHEQD